MIVDKYKKLRKKENDLFLKMYDLNLEELDSFFDDFLEYLISFKGYYKDNFNKDNLEITFDDLNKCYEEFIVRHRQYKKIGSFLLVVYLIKKEEYFQPKIPVFCNKEESDYFFKNYNVIKNMVMKEIIHTLLFSRDKSHEVTRKLLEDYNDVEHNSFIMTKSAFLFKYCCKNAEKTCANSCFSTNIYDYDLEVYRDYVDLLAMLDIYLNPTDKDSIPNNSKEITLIRNMLSFYNFSYKEIKSNMKDKLLHEKSEASIKDERFNTDKGFYYNVGTFISREDFLHIDNLDMVGYVFNKYENGQYPFKNYLDYLKSNNIKFNSLTDTLEELTKKNLEKFDFKTPDQWWRYILAKYPCITRLKMKYHNLFIENEKVFVLNSSYYFDEHSINLFVFGLYHYILIDKNCGKEISPYLDESLSSEEHKFFLQINDCKINFYGEFENKVKVKSEDGKFSKEYVFDGGNPVEIYEKIYNEVISFTESK